MIKQQSRRWMLAVFVMLTAAFVALPTRPQASSAIVQQPPVKMVLAEYATGTWCPYCPGSSGALKRLEERVGTNNLAVLAYHDDSQFGNEAAEAWLAQASISAFPTVIFNGLYRRVGGSTNPNETSIDAGYNSVYNLAKQRPLPVDVALSGRLLMESPAVSRIEFTVTVTALTDVPSPAQLQFVLYEDNINYRASNGESHFDWVVRKKLPPAPLTLTMAGQTETFERSFLYDGRQYRYRSNPTQLGIVAYVHLNASRPEVLQAARLQLY